MSAGWLLFVSVAMLVGLALQDSAREDRARRAEREAGGFRKARQAPDARRP